MHYETRYVRGEFQTGEQGGLLARMRASLLEAIRPNGTGAIAPTFAHDEIVRIGALIAAQFNQDNLHLISDQHVPVPLHHRNPRLQRPAPHSARAQRSVPVQGAGSTERIVHAVGLMGAHHQQHQQTLDLIGQKVAELRLAVSDLQVVGGQTQVMVAGLQAVAAVEQHVALSQAEAIQTDHDVAECIGLMQASGDGSQAPRDGAGQCSPTRFLFLGSLALHSYMSHHKYG